LVVNRTSDIAIKEGISGYHFDLRLNRAFVDAIYHHTNPYWNERVESIEIRIVDRSWLCPLVPISHVLYHFPTKETSRHYDLRRGYGIVVRPSTAGQRRRRRERAKTRRDGDDD
jgi:hypothetical protein